MKRYIYIQCDHLADRGYNHAIRVYKLKAGGFPKYIGANYKINTASTKGDDAVAAKVVCEIEGYRMDRTGYYVANKDVEIRSL
jgi:hypothetical protein